MTRDERLTRITRIEHRQSQLARMMTRTLEQLAEHNLRLRFILDYFRFERPVDGGLIVNGAQEMQTASLFDIYCDLGGRADALARLEADVCAAEAADLNTFEQEQTDADDHEARGADSVEPSADGAAGGEPGTPGDTPDEAASAVLGPRVPRRLRPDAKATTH